jgi:DNA transposition AAA+ family ATPase
VPNVKTILHIAITFPPVNCQKKKDHMIMYGRGALGETLNQEEREEKKKKKIRKGV